MRYDAILIDCMNLLYKLKEKNERASVLSSKYVFKGLAAKYLETIKNLAADYLAENGSVYLLFDNPTSRLDLQKSFYFATRKHVYPKYKEQRAKESKEFYNTLDLIRYYYLTSTSEWSNPSLATIVLQKRMYSWSLTTMIGLAIYPRT